MLKKIITVQLIMLFTVLCASAHEGEDHSYEVQETTWLQIQRTIFDPKCVGCHSAGTAFARQSGLVLSDDVAYESLIDRDPKNRAALGDGLKLINTTAFDRLENSFLWLKIDASEQEHFLTDHPEYGALMPLTDFPLTNGELELIKQWILAGAPRDGVVVDPEVLDDTSVYEPLEFKPLDPPEFGHQIKVGPFRVPAGRDREVYLYQSLNNPEPVFVKKIEMTMAPGSHHIVLWANSDGQEAPPENVIRDLYDPVDGAPLTSSLPILVGEMLAASQNPNYNYVFPPGVGLKLNANLGIDINSHYAAASSEQTGEAYINLHYVEEENVVNEAEIMWLRNDLIVIPPNTEQTFDGVYDITEPTHILQMWSHGHEALLEFWIEISQKDNPNQFELVYYSDDWEHPPVLNFDPPLTLERGQKIKFTARYFNFTNKLKHFGVLSTDEMMMVFGYWIKGDLNLPATVNEWELY